MQLFPLNATLNRHIEGFVKEDLYADDINSGSRTIDETIQLYDKSKKMMQKGGFNLRKWQTFTELTNFVQLIYYTVLYRSFVCTIFTVYSLRLRKLVNHVIEQMFPLSFSNIPLIRAIRIILSTIRFLLHPSFLIKSLSI